MDLHTTTHVVHEAAADKLQGRIVEATAEKLVLTSDVVGEQGYILARDAQVTRDGKPCHIEDLKRDELVRITVRKDDETEVLKIECDDG